MNRKLYISFVSILSILLSLAVAFIQQNVPTSIREQLPLLRDATPIASPSGTPVAAHNGNLVRVVSVVDGDTIKIDGGEIVRYIGVNTPETVAPFRPVECYGKEASAQNKSLVSGQMVELEKDVSERDRYGRLLRYVWIGDTMINEALVRQGFAQVSTYPPDVKYESRFIAAQRQAMSDNLGLWSGVCPLPSPKTKQTAPSASDSGTLGTQSEQFVCDCSKSCEQMTSCEEAQYQLSSCGCRARDVNSDGKACDTRCK